MDFKRFDELYDLPEVEFWALFASLEASDRDFATFEAVAMARKAVANG